MYSKLASPTRVVLIESSLPSPVTILWINFLQAIPMFHPRTAFVWRLSKLPSSKLKLGHRKSQPTPMVSLPEAMTPWFKEAPENRSEGQGRGKLLKRTEAIYWQEAVETWNCVWHEYKRYIPWSPVDSGVRSHRMDEVTSFGTPSPQPFTSYSVLLTPNSGCRNRGKDYEIPYYAHPIPRPRGHAFLACISDPQLPGSSLN